MVVVAHRLVTIQNVDVFFVLENAGMGRECWRREAMQRLSDVSLAGLGSVERFGCPFWTIVLESFYNFGIFVVLTMRGTIQFLPILLNLRTSASRYIIDSGISTSSRISVIIQ